MLPLSKANWDDRQARSSSMLQKREKYQLKNISNLLVLLPTIFISILNILDFFPHILRSIGSVVRYFDAESIARLTLKDFVQESMFCPQQ